MVRTRGCDDHRRILDPRDRAFSCRSEGQARVRVGPIVKRITAAGVACSAVRSDLLPNVWTELGWLCMPQGWEWCCYTKQTSYALCESELEAFQQVTLWQLEKRKPMVPVAERVAAGHLRLVK